MISTIYLEEEIAEHPRALEILDRFPRATVVSCRRYGEVFNRRAQSFRLQKRRPALIVARKHDRFVHPTPAGYGIGHERSFYFSHMLNCLYDCRYCFLQGMYRSANYVVFVNYEDFFGEIARTAAEESTPSCFFSGYDCDSLAFEKVTGFVARALPFFRGVPGAWLELRTKSTQIEALLAEEPFERCVVAFSFTPEEVSLALEHQVPALERRLRAMARLARHGWRLGLRFDPLIFSPDFRARYRGLFEQVFKVVAGEALHSVSLGPFRLPTGFFRNVERLYPEEPLFAGPLEERSGMVSYGAGLEGEMVGFCTEELLRHVPREVFFPCAVGAGS